MNRIQSFLLLIAFTLLFSVSVQAVVQTQSVSYVYDDFAGANGDPWDTTLWTENDADGSIHIQDNRGDINANANQLHTVTTDQNIWNFTDGDDINISYTYVTKGNSSGESRARVKLHNTNGDGLNGGCASGSPLICINVTDAQSEFIVDDNVMTTSTISDGSKIIISLNLITDTNNFDLDIYLDNNREVSLTLTRDTHDFNFSFQCQSTSGGAGVFCAYDSVDLNGIDSFDANGITSNFTITPTSPITLDPELGILNVNTDLNDTSQLFGITDVNYLWSIDGEEISTDQNTTRDFNVVGDFNVSLLVVGQDGTTTFTSQTDQNVLVRNAPQSIDITFSWNPISASSDVNFTATPSGQNAYIWGFPSDNNLSGQTVQKSFIVGDAVEACVVVTSVSDVNKVHCENFFNTHVLSKVPIDISNLVAITTPYDVSVDSTPGQSYSQISTDQNFWFFYQETDENFFNLSVDANVNFLVTTLLIRIGGTDLNQTIQPYVVPTTLGVSVIFTTVDSITNDIIPAVLLIFNRTISGVGDVQTGSGITDDLGRLSLPFVPNIDHNFSIEFPGGTIIRTGTYSPQAIDATNGVNMLLPESDIQGDTNATGNVDINFVQSQVTPSTTGIVDLNQIVTSTRAISTIQIDVDHNSVNLFTDTNSGAVAEGGIFGQTVDTTGLSRLLPLVITYNITFADGNTFSQSKSVTIATQGNLFDSFTNAKDDLGDLGGTMILSAFILALLLGILHFSFPLVDNSHSFVIAALLLLFLSFVGYVDGISWVFASLAGGTAYFLRRLDK